MDGFRDTLETACFRNAQPVASNVQLNRGNQGFESMGSGLHFVGTNVNTLGL